VQLLSGAFILSSAIATGVYSIAKYAKDSELNHYKQLLEQAATREGVLKARLELAIKAADRRTPPDPTGNTALVTLLGPKSGQLVEHLEEVDFVVQGDVPDGFKPVLVVRDPQGQWWSWGSDKTGRFPKVQFGRASDEGESYEVRVILTKAETPRGHVMTNLPRFIASDSAIVIRK
jgi:hypothetical protein